MTKIEKRHTKFMLGLILAFCSQAAWGGIYQHGTVVRMRMVDCLPVHHGFMMAMGGTPTQVAAEVCPEYTLVSDKVVFVIVGRSSNQLVPLADVVDFRFNKNELAMRVDDSKHESKFSIKEMILRTDWDLLQKHINDQMANTSRSADTNVALRKEGFKHSVEIWPPRREVLQSLEEPKADKVPRFLIAFSE